MLGVVAEPKFQYGAEAFEAYQQTTKEETANIILLLLRDKG